MTKYKVIFTFPNGNTEEDDDGPYDSIEEANDAALQWISDYDTGGEVLNLSNPGDYPYDPDEAGQIDFDIIEIEE